MMLGAGVILCHRCRTFMISFHYHQLRYIMCPLRWHTGSILPLQKASAMMTRQFCYRDSAVVSDNQPTPSSSSYGVFEPPDDITGDTSLEDDANCEYDLDGAVLGNATGVQRVLVLQPRFRKRRRRYDQIGTFEADPELELQETEALVHTLPNWEVVGSALVSTKSRDARSRSRVLWGSGKLAELSEQIESLQATSVVINTRQLHPTQQAIYFDCLRVPVYDRFTLVLLIFKTFASTREAKLQIALAQIPYIRERLDYLAGKHLSSASVHMTAEHTSTLRESSVSRDQRIRGREHRLVREIEELRAVRKAHRDERAIERNRGRPTIAVIGYTNAGKTSLIRRLTDNARLKPLDRLFATLDTTVYSGRLPCLMPVYYADTIGFISNLPHRLIGSFNATLDDIRHANLLIHVRDISHPNTLVQKQQVLKTLASLQLEEHLLSNMIEVKNKWDKVGNKDSMLLREDNYYFDYEHSSVLVSCTSGRGLDELTSLIEQRVFTVIGAKPRLLKVPIGSPAYGYLHRNAAFLAQPIPSPCGQYLLVKVAMNDGQMDKFCANFRYANRQQQQQ